MPLRQFPPTQKRNTQGITGVNRLAKEPCLEKSLAALVVLRVIIDWSEGTPRKEKELLVFFFFARSRRQSVRDRK
jgi:hypothetical protein